MNTPTTISVDPGRITLGALHPDSTLLKNAAQTLAPRSKRLTADNLFSFISGINSSTSKGLSLKILLLRLLTSMFLTYTAFGLIHSSYANSSQYLGAQGTGIIISISTGMILFGIASRIPAILLSLYFGIEFSIGTIQSNPDSAMLGLCIISFAVALFGSGKYSFDFIIRRKLQTIALYKRKKEKCERLSYKAFRNSI